MYFLRRLRPLEVSGERVRSLRLSLNTPVLSTPDLPSGPSRAMILVHREARGGMDTTVGVRSVGSGDVAYWSFDGELVSDADLSVAADAALTFAESLGFLFEEAPIAGGARAEKAFRSWLEGESPPTPAVRESDPSPRASASDAASAEPPELALEDLVVADGATLDSPSPLAGAPPAAAAHAPKPPPGPKLSKFRSHAAASEAKAAAPGARKRQLRQPLARVQLVKRRSPEDERKLVLRKLLTSF
jgi:hypothetical protein